jgi:hypothetical protein
LALKTAKAAYVYPEFQFDSNGNVVSGLLDLTVVLAPRLPDPWDLARWLTTPPTDPSPIQLLRAGETAAALERAQQLISSEED